MSNNTDTKPLTVEQVKRIRDDAVDFLTQQGTVVGTTRASDTRRLAVEWLEQRRVLEMVTNLQVTSTWAEIAAVKAEGARVLS